MERWRNRVALVTGSGSGIGATIAFNLAKHGMTVIGCARNIQPIDELVERCAKESLAGKIISYRCDLSLESEIEKMFEWIHRTTQKGVDVLVNNAGYGTMTPLLQLSGKEMVDMMNVNVVAPITCAKLAVHSMTERGIDDGHIFNINSMLGHSVVGIMHFYSATKFALDAATQGLRKELAEMGSRIRVTSLSPGRTETKFHFNKSVLGDRAENFYKNIESLTPQDVNDALIYALSTPASVQVYDVKIQPTNLGNLNAYKSS